MSRALAFCSRGLNFGPLSDVLVVMPTKTPLKPKPEYAYPKYLEVVALSAERAMTFLETGIVPVDLGPAPRRPGNRIWGFPVTGKTFIETNP